MTAEGHMLVTPEAIAGAQADTGSTHASIDNELQQLRAYLAPLVSSWTGSASTAYQGLQKQWDTAAADLNQVLNTISVALGTAHENYGSAETANTRTWVS